jgi:hypothetical protein
MRIPSIAREAPATACYVAVLLVTSAVQIAVPDGTRHALLLGSSSDVAHLTRDPVLALVASAFWLQDATSAALVVLAVLVLAVGERRLGTRHTVVIFVLGHVVATLLTEVPVGVAAHLGWLTSAHDHRLDVGPSYGTYAVAGALALDLPPGVRRRAFATMLVLAAVLPLVFDSEVTTAGHAIALLVGLVTQRASQRRSPQARTPRPGRPCPVHP